MFKVPFKIFVAAGAACRSPRSLIPVFSCLIPATGMVKGYIHNGGSCQCAYMLLHVCTPHNCVCSGITAFKLTNYDCILLLHSACVMIHTRILGSIHALHNYNCGRGVGLRRLINPLINEIMPVLNNFIFHSHTCFMQACMFRNTMTSVSLGHFLGYSFVCDWIMTICCLGYKNRCPCPRSSSYRGTPGSAY
ncbi:hypothetical protein DFH27DRAFT_193914 [Peziza echinospora]|nr:hypothetical protein DFH27DRAFT_193914 [Peziza echinospora]